MCVFTRSRGGVERAGDERERAAVGDVFGQDVQDAPAQDRRLGEFLGIGAEAGAARMPAAGAEKRAAVDLERELLRDPRLIEPPAASRVKAIFRRRRRELGDRTLPIEREHGAHSEPVRTGPPRAGRLRSG